METSLERHRGETCANCGEVLNCEHGRKDEASQDGSDIRGRMKSFAGSGSVAPVRTRATSSTKKMSTETLNLHQVRDHLHCFPTRAQTTCRARVARHSAFAELDFLFALLYNRGFTGGLP
jgi:hypothetical protein